MKAPMKRSKNYSEAGFTLIEVLAALALFGLIAAGVTPAFINFTKFNSEMDMRSEALAAAQWKLDELRFESPQDMPTGGVFGPENYVINNRTFEVVTTYCENGGYCPTNNTRHIKVEVSYDDKELVQIETVYTMLR